MIKSSHSSMTTMSTCLILLLVLSCFLQVSSNGDAEILSRVKSTRLVDPDGTLNDWVITRGGERSPCNWTGVTCDVRNGTVTAIDLSGFNISEYGYTSRVNEKSDVYSFGVVLLELITGKRPNDSSFGENKDIIKFAMETALCYSSPSPEGEAMNRVSPGNFRDLGKLVDPKMELSTREYEEIEKVLEVALLCTSSFPISRPTMRRVVELLKEKKPFE